MILAEEFGGHLHRALTAFLAELGPVGEALTAAFPFLAIILGATLLVEHLNKLKEAHEKLTEDQVRFGTAAQTAFNALDEKLLEAGIKAAELRNDHIGALQKRIELLDKQSLDELVSSFATVAKAADVVLGELGASWYEFNTGSRGAQHALTLFQTQYESLLRLGKDKEASDLLKGTRESAERVLALQQQAKNSGSYQTAAAGGAAPDVAAHEAAIAELRKVGVGYADKEVQAQQTLVDTLQKQEVIQVKVADLRKLNVLNDKMSVSNDAAALQAAGAKEHIAAELQMHEQELAADRAAANARMDIARASVAERLAADIGFADRDAALKLAANQQDRAALDKAAKDYANQLKANGDRAAESRDGRTAPSHRAVRRACPASFRCGWREVCPAAGGRSRGRT